MGVGDVDQLGRAEAASLLQWWLAAGVDSVVAEQPRHWLGTTTAAPDLVQPVLQPAAAAMPGTIGEFRQWLQSAELPLGRPGMPRALPEGPETAPVMVVTDAPAREDAVQGRAIGGDARRLLERMLAAIGLPLAQTSLVPLSHYPLPAGRLDAGGLEQCAGLLRHHVRLAGPRRLLLLGDAPCRALLGEGLASARGRVHQLGGVQVMATFHPRFLIQRPSDKARAWQDLLVFSAMETQ